MGVKFQKVYAATGEVDKRNFSHFGTANLNISFNHVEWIFYYFGGVDFKNSEDLMIMIINDIQADLKIYSCINKFVPKIV